MTIDGKGLESGIQKLRYGRQTAPTNLTQDKGNRCIEIES